MLPFFRQSWNQETDARPSVENLLSHKPETKLFVSMESPNIAVFLGSRIDPDVIILEDSAEEDNLDEEEDVIKRGKPNPERIRLFSSDSEGSHSNEPEKKIKDKKYSLVTYKEGYTFVSDRLSDEIETPIDHSFVDNIQTTLSSGNHRTLYREHMDQDWSRPWSAK